MKARDPVITVEEVRERLSYEPETGILRHRHSHSGVKAGQEAGVIDRVGYRRLKVKGEHVFAHRLIWFYMTGSWPEFIDHCNEIKSDNRWANLREATKPQNGANVAKARSDSLTGLRGVNTCRYKNGTVWYQARAQVKGVRKALGAFRTPEEAKAAYEAFRRSIDKEFYHAQHIRS